MHKKCATYKKSYVRFLDIHIKQGYKVGLEKENTNLRIEVHFWEKKRGMGSGRGTQRPPSISAVCYLF